MKTEGKKTTKKEDKVIPFPKEKEKRRQIKNNLVRQATINNVNQKTTTSSSKTPSR